MAKQQTQKKVYFKSISYDDLEGVYKKISSICEEKKLKIASRWLWKKSIEKIQQDVLKQQKQQGLEECFRIDKENCKEIKCKYRALCQNDNYAKIYLTQELIKVIKDNYDFFTKEKEIFNNFMQALKLKEVEDIDTALSIIEENIKLHLEKIPVSDFIQKLYENKIIDDIDFHPNTAEELINKFENLSINAKRNFCTLLGFNFNEDSTELNYVYIKNRILFNQQTSEEEMYNEKTIIDENNNIFDNIKDITYDSAAFTVPANIEIFKGAAVIAFENYKIELKQKANKIIENCTKLYICDSKNKLITYFDLVQDITDTNKYFLTLSRENNKFYKSGEYNAYLTDNELNKANKALHNKININLLELEEANTVLCIDFGTTNTTIGTYLAEGYVKNITSNSYLIKFGKYLEFNEINHIKFISEEDSNSEKDSNKRTSLMPTVVYVKEIKDDTIEYLFGYDARKRIKEFNYSPRASYFTNIKKWLNDLEKDIYIVDENGKTTTLPAKEILKAFFEYLIGITKDYFKCKFNTFHFSTPVNFKEKYIGSLKTIFKSINKDYQIIEPEEALDEAAAVLYDVIYKEFTNLPKNTKTPAKKALIIDCGGGTTDLAGCEFVIEKDAKGRGIFNIKIIYEDNIAEFGGNQLTDVIFRYLVIYYANSVYSEIETKINKLVNLTSNIITYIDEHPDRIKEYFSKFDKEYEKATEIIPVEYDKYRDDNTVYTKAKFNYHLLWELAENIKKTFFNSTEESLENVPREILNTDKKIKFYYFLQNSKNKDLNDQPTDKCLITYRDIQILLEPLIYVNVKQLLEGIEDKLLEYDYIKLSGQTTIIDFFRTSLKEFIPGRKIKTMLESKQTTSIEDLKLTCLNGACSYINFKNLGFINNQIVYMDPRLKYNISAQTPEGTKVLLKEDTLLKSAIGYYDILKTGKDIRIYINGDLRLIPLKTKGKKNVSFEEIKNEDSRFTDELLNTISEDDIRIVLLTNEDKNSLVIYSVELLKNHRYSFAKLEEINLQNI